jgi:hypothetical protein
MSGKGIHGMDFQHRLASPRCGLLGGFVLLFVVGCSGGSANQALEKSLATSGFKHEDVCPLAGKITVDGLPPQVANGEKIVVALNDPSKPTKGGLSGSYTIVGKDGEFAFKTYAEGDGVKPGTYILTFAKLKAQKKKGLVGPDEFHNLYNDAERNAKEHPELKIDHKAAKTDYSFDLKIAGVQPQEPGPGALTHIVIRGYR